jgi:hypothetical protein
MKRFVALSIVVGALTILPATAAFAADPGTMGQPSQSCGSSNALITPGNAVNAPGSAFNPNGVAGTVYANPGSQGGTSSGNSHVVAQYDVACFQVSQPH